MFCWALPSKQGPFYTELRDEAHMLDRVHPHRHRRWTRKYTMTNSSWRVYPAYEDLSKWTRRLDQGSTCVSLDLGGAQQITPFIDSAPIQFETHLRILTNRFSDIMHAETRFVSGDVQHFKPSQDNIISLNLVKPSMGLQIPKLSPRTGSSPSPSFSSAWFSTDCVGCPASSDGFCFE